MIRDRVTIISESEMDGLFRDLITRYSFRRRRLLTEYALQHDRHDILCSIKNRNGLRNAIYCICPFHQAYNASFRLLPNGYAQCFGCLYRANFVKLLHDMWMPYDLEDLKAIIRDFIRLRKGFEEGQLRLNL